MWQTKEIKISEIEQMLEDGFDVEVDSPDGWVQVGSYVDKGEWDEYVLSTDNGYEVICNENHLFKSVNGWMTAKQLYDLQEHDQYVNTEQGFSRAVVRYTGNKVPIVDIYVNHENHRYFTNGVESHNTGGGKSMFMSHCSATALMMNYNVLYITMELSETKVRERIDANLQNIDLNALPQMSKTVFLSNISRLKQSTRGRLFIKEYPAGEPTVHHFKQLLNDLKGKSNFVPDMIVVDYLNICGTSRVKLSQGSYLYNKAIAEELRALATSTNTVILTGTQFNRTGMSTTDPGLNQTSDSVGIPFTVDFMFAMYATDDLAAKNQKAIKQLKNRYNDENYFNKFVIGCDKGKMKFYDVENSAQLDPSAEDDEFEMAVFDKTPTADKMKRIKDLFE